MNITGSQLDVEYASTSIAFGDIISNVESDFNLPPFSMYAIGSRETNLSPYYIDHPGDGGHGHGLWQVDDRSHDIPADWATDIEWQCRKGAEIFNDCLGATNDDIVAALNMYNSGQAETQYTTGKDYGPDVESRRQYLLNKYGEEEFVAGESFVNLNSGLAADVSGQSNDNGAGVLQWIITGKKNQSIIIEKANGGVRIQFEHSGKYLDYDPNRLNAVQYDKANVPGQVFTLNREPNGAYVIQTFDGKVLDVEAESADGGARLIFWPKKTSVDGTISNQQFVVVRFR